MNTWSCVDGGGLDIRRWLRSPTTFPVQLNRALGWKWVSCLSTILLHRKVQGLTWMGKITNTWKGWKPLNGVLVGLPGVRKVESCTKPQHLRWFSLIPDIDSSARSSWVPGPTTGPVKVTMGDGGESSSWLSNILPAILRQKTERVSSRGEVKEKGPHLRIVSVIANNERRNGVVLGAVGATSLGWRYLPSKGVWMNTAIEKEE